MPRYDYRCPNCATGEEIVCSVLLVDELKVYCGVCNALMRRMFNAPGLVFKGTGWAGKKPPPTTTEKSE